MLKILLLIALVYSLWKCFYWRCAFMGVLYHIGVTYGEKEQPSADEVQQLTVMAMKKVLHLN